MIALGLIRPKYAHNVGGIIRAASCFGAHRVYYTGDRIDADLEQLGRLPREERMKGYAEVKWGREERFFDRCPDLTPVAVEVTPNAESLFDFIHPERALYVFGPEDGGIPQVARQLCHRFVTIPSVHCTNLAAAVYVILYDRAQKEHRWHVAHPGGGICADLACLACAARAADVVESLSHRSSSGESARPITA